MKPLFVIRRHAQIQLGNIESNLKECDKKNGFFDICIDEYAEDLKKSAQNISQIYDECLGNYNGDGSLKNTGSGASNANIMKDVDHQVKAIGSQIKIQNDKSFTIL